MSNNSNSKNLSSLVRELRERIAATSATPPNNGDIDALETRFRAVLRNLLHSYVVPSSSANEREVIAVLKLISHTAKNFPGVFYHGKATAILPVIGRILPFFAEPSFRSRHGVIFDTVGSLLSLLRTGSRDAYRMLFMDAMCIIEGSISLENSQTTEVTELTLKCFHRSFSGILGDSMCLCDLPTSNKPVDGPGILINLLGRNRWQHLATWLIKLLSKCLTEGTLYVEGLINTSFVDAACTLLCYRDADLHMACFDFARVIGSVMSYDVVPHENLIQSISAILGEDEEGLPVFRNSAYDSSIALSVLGPDRVGGGTTDHNNLGLSSSSDKSIKNPKVGVKRNNFDVDTFKIKRQKIEQETKVSKTNVRGDINVTDIVSYEKEEGYAHTMHESLLLFVELLNSPSVKQDSLRPDVALTALSLLCIAFCRYPQTNMSLCIFRQMMTWIPWICDQAKQGSSITLDTSFYLEGIHSMLLVQGGFELLLSKAVRIRNELFDYLSIRLASCPKMVKEFAEAVLGVETEELLKKMIPVVLPKLVVSQEDNDQAVDTLYELAKCLNTDMVPLIVNWLPKDSAALAIQELLKIAGCEASLDENVALMSQTKGKEPLKTSAVGIKTSGSSSGTNSRGQKLWDRFSNYVKEIIAPCLTSRFQLQNVSDSTSSGPIYGPSMSFRRWIFSWIKKLTAHAIGSRASIFIACRGIVRHDMQTAMYLLPYLVLNAVCHGTEKARHGITEEIQSVLSAAASENSGAAVYGVSGRKNEVCVQAVFTLLDNLGQWVDDVKQELALKSFQSSASRQQASKSKDQSFALSASQDQLLEQCNYVSELLSNIPKVTLARASFRCQAYARSLMYFESYVQGKSGSFNPAAKRSGIFDDEDISYLMEIYSCLDELDGLSGLACLRKSLSLQDQLLINKKAGNWAEVLTACEQALQMEPTSVQRHSDVLNCLLNMCHLQAMVTHVDGLISRIPKYKKTWCMQGVQAAWRLGRWDLMDEYLSGADEEGLLCSSSESNASFDLDVAKILQAMMKKDRFLVAEKIALSKQALIAPLAAAGMDSYTRAYPIIVKLHLLCELEDFHALLIDESFLEKSFHLGDCGFSIVMENWENRLRFTQPSLWAREPLLAFRRLVFGASNLGAQVGNCWLQYAKLCRLAGHYETANRAILEAQASGAANVHMEKAKLLWSTRRSDGAIAELQQSLLNMPQEVVGSAAISSITSLSLVPLKPQSLPVNTQTMNENQEIAKTLLLYSRWIHYTGLKQKEDVISLYSRVKELQPKWEKGYFYMAKYCDEVLVDARKRQEENLELGPKIVPSASIIAASSSSNTEKNWWSYLPDVMLFYAKGLHRGHKNLFQALPRLLTLWFDFGSMYPQSGAASNKDLRKVQDRIISIMRGCLKDLPTHQWLTVLPQLVSRICHQNEDIVKLVKTIIISVVRKYPQQALWIMAAVSKSTVPSRRDAAAEIIQAARKGFSQGNSGSNLFVQFASLIDHLIRLCFHAGQPKSKVINIATEFSALKRMMPLGIIMPIQQSLTVSSPTYDVNLTESLSSDVFSGVELPTIFGIADEAEILSSLQRPKKIVLLGSDGIERPFLCKPKDDLRKDARMMEFTAMINRLLSKYPESRRRKLYIRTFAVIPLTEDCGMVEWVPHTRGLRHILQDIYITCGKFDRQKTNPQIKRIYDQCQGKIPEDEMLKDKILPMFPPVFHQWFLTTFSEPAAWFRARVAYAHTTAVWSMVGHIVGLGDRHGENILFDSTTGDCVHVDFSCLFDKGLLLEKPELVPFRLTQNMIDGLGITGYEGIFLRICEITLSVLRTHRETLMSVLETFIHDPLVEWTKSHKSSGVEVQNPHAQRAISNIEARLQGVVVGVAAAPSLPLAVEGQARRLIAEAVSHKNLGKMYIWWMPWF
ncbi:hypothetical protein COLO4_18014 [Corchorus olitorius]|uniref:Serine/threonine-protein kinase ATR n=1 Tax=Corchorus olitorius TaxID=93759 RepID=A0A1R3JAQ5_9ROSI|nr:hypothetical protein COLO4_18014 [Corchorus olitorius]